MYSSAVCHGFWEQQVYGKQPRHSCYTSMLTVCEAKDRPPADSTLLILGDRWIDR